MLHLFHGMLTFQSQKASEHCPQTGAHNCPNSQGCSNLHQLLNTAVSRALEIYSTSTQDRLFLLLI